MTRTPVKVRKNGKNSDLEREMNVYMLMKNYGVRNNLLV